MYPLVTWFVSEICVWIPCIKETMMMIMMIIITTTTTTITIMVFVVCHRI